MALNPNIILSGNQLDVVGSLDRGMVAGQRVADQRQKNMLREFYQTNGADIAAGKPQAINALAGIDPDAAMKVQAQRLDQDRVRLGMDATRVNMRQAEQQMEMLTREEQRAIDDRARAMSAEERAAASEQLQQAANMVLNAQSPEEFDSIMQSMGLDEYMGQFANRETLAARGLSTADAFKRYDAANAPVDPSKRYQTVGGQLVDLQGQGGPAPVPGIGGQNDSAAEQKIARIMELEGVDRPTAIKIADGVLRVDTDPVTRETTYTDLSQPLPARQAAPQATPRTAEQPATLTYGDQYPAAGDSFGVGGFARRAVNSAADTLGAGAVFPEVEDTQADFGILKESLVNDIASGYERQPPSWLLENIERLVPQAGRISQGADRAQSQLRALGRSFDSELSTVNGQLQSRQLSPTDRAKLESRRAALTSAKARVDSAIGAFSQQDGGNVTSSGIKWSVE